MYQEKKRSLFFGLPLSFTTYRIEEKVVNIKKGFLRTEEDDTYCRTRTAQSQNPSYNGVGCRCRSV